MLKIGLILNNGKDNQPVFKKSDLINLQEFSMYQA